MNNDLWSLTYFRTLNFQQFWPLKFWEFRKIRQILQFHYFHFERKFSNVKIFKNVTHWLEKKFHRFLTFTNSVSKFPKLRISSNFNVFSFQINTTSPNDLILWYNSNGKSTRLFLTGAGGGGLGLEAGVGGLEAGGGGLGSLLTLILRVAWDIWSRSQGVLEKPVLRVLRTVSGSRPRSWSLAMFGMHLPGWRIKKGNVFTSSNFTF